MSRHWFDGGNPLPLVKPGTVAERVQARHNAAALVLRNGGDAEDLKILLDALELWPSQDQKIIV